MNRERRAYLLNAGFEILAAHHELTELLGGTCNFDESYIDAITAGLIFYGEEKNDKKAEA